MWFPNASSVPERDAASGEVRFVERAVSWVAKRESGARSVMYWVVMPRLVGTVSVVGDGGILMACTRWRGVRQPMGLDSIRARGIGGRTGHAAGRATKGSNDVTMLQKFEVSSPTPRRSTDCVQSSVCNGDQGPSA
jgi:hypothetical protein